MYTPGGSLGEWSQVSAFELKGMPAQGLTITKDLWTPVLSWTLTEGAHSYDVEIDDDADFAYPRVLTRTTKMNTYIPDAITFIDGKTYYARVRTNRSPSISNPVSNVVSFTGQPPQVTGLQTLPETSAQSPAQYNPTLCWDPTGGAWKYRLEISGDSSFKFIDAVGGQTEQRCYTIPAGWRDGTFYWRVTPLDGSLMAGLPSAPVQSWKRYPAPGLIYPTARVDGTPLFTWSAVDGADRYRLEISDMPNFSVIRYAVTTVNNEHQPVRKLDFGNYYWRVKIIDRDTIEGPFSSYYTAYPTYLPAVLK